MTKPVVVTKFEKAGGPVFQWDPAGARREIDTLFWGSTACPTECLGRLFIIRIYVPRSCHPVLRVVVKVCMYSTPCSNFQSKSPAFLCTF